MTIPHRFKPLFWSDKIDEMDIKKYKDYIIHQVLHYGSLSDIKWLFKTYGKKEMIKTFIEKPSKNYPKKIFYFIKNYILDIKDLNLDENDYITSISGPVRQRAAKSL